MLTIQVNGKKYDVPIRWEEVTFAQFIRWSKMENRLSCVLADIIGVDESFLVGAQMKGATKVYQALDDFLHRDMQYVVPDKVMGYSIPKDLESETIGQIEDLRSILKEVEGKPVDDLLAKYPLIVATYTCSQATGRAYDFKDAEKLAPYFEGAPAPEVLAIGHFTLIKYKQLRRHMLPNSLKSPIRMSKFRRAWISLQRLGGSITRYFTWRVARLTSGKS